MIQRIQTVWLLLVVILLALTFKLEFYSGTNATTNTLQKLFASENVLISVITIAVLFCAGAAIFLYKKRSNQLMLCIAGILVELLLIFLYWQKTSMYVAGSGTYALWAIIHPINILLFLLATKAINKDEKMVQDSDRLR